VPCRPARSAAPRAVRPGPETQFDRLVEGGLNRSGMAINRSRLASLKEPITPVQKVVLGHRFPLEVYERIVNRSLTWSGPRPRVPCPGGSAAADPGKSQARLTRPSAQPVESACSLGQRESAAALG
jgi:hypothetical protein